MTSNSRSVQVARKTTIFITRSASAEVYPANNGVKHKRHQKYEIEIITRLRPDWCPDWQGCETARIAELILSEGFTVSSVFGMRPGNESGPSAS
jgi:hypothetical protein